MIISKFQPRISVSIGRRYLCATAVRNNVLMSAQDARELVGEPGVKFVDVRDPRLFVRSHVPGAVNIVEFFTYLAMSSQRGKEHLQKAFTTLLRSHGICSSDHLITYEGNFRGMYGASCRAWYILDLLGHTQTSVIHGGWEAWTEGKHIKEVGHEKDTPEGDFQANWNGIGWADWTDVKSLVETSGCETKLLDVRDMVEWNGKSSSPYGADFAPRKGRLPKAIHMEWYSMMTEADEGDPSYFKSPDEILEITGNVGIKPEDDVMVYCFKGARAANTMLALQTAGFNNVTNYFGSWNEWSRNKDLVIDSETYDHEDPNE